jgi:hypothetical protein
VTGGAMLLNMDSLPQNFLHWPRQGRAAGERVPCACGNVWNDPDMYHSATTRQMMPIGYGTRQLTMAHIRKLARHFALPADYFLEV